MDCPAGVAVADELLTLLAHKVLCVVPEPNAERPPAILAVVDVRELQRILGVHQDHVTTGPVPPGQVKGNAFFFRMEQKQRINQLVAHQLRAQTLHMFVCAAVTARGLGGGEAYVGRPCHPVDTKSSPYLQTSRPHSRTSR